MRLQRSSPTQTVHFLLRRLLVKRSAQRGFTLIELLVAMLIGSLIVSGLLYGVVEIMQTNQKDAARSDTQRDIQSALDYIARDVREATFVYGVSENQSCLAAYDPAVALQRGKDGKCTGLLAFLPDFLKPTATQVPVLAFWKPEPLPFDIRTACRNQASNVGVTGTANQDLNATPCVAQRMYTLVVYSLSQEPATTFSWRGRARITRFQLPHFTETAGLGDITPGWAAPIAKDKRPLTWPVGDRTDASNVVTTNVNAQEPPGVTPAGIPGGSVVLTDFVDFEPTTYDPRFCPDGFAAPSGINTSGTPSTTFNKAFYACVRTGSVTASAGSSTSTTEAVDAAAQAGQGLNPEVHIVVRGNAAGKGGIPIDASGLQFQFQMETRVLSRGVYGKLAN